ncbi:MAG: helix-turn-helix domain-containing protein [Bacteroidaceae bacterium]|nr:helix-turn-helix domain-containing protein [Bacteroidaceae bacterium]
MYRFLILFAYLSLCLTGYGQLHTPASNYSFHQISLKEGLSQSYAQAILLDSKGTLWIGTKGGLNQYIQQQLKVFLHHPEEPASIPHNQIHHLVEDSVGTIWVSTANGIATYNYQGDEFTLISRSVAYSSLKTEGGILFGGDNFILRYNYQLKNIERIYLSPTESTNNPTLYRVQRLIPWGKDQVLVGTRQKGIYLFNLTTHEFKPFITTPRPLLMSLYVASDNKVYTSHYGHGLYCYDRTGKELAHYTTSNSQLTNNYILDITEYKDKLWLATDGGGICLLPLAGGEISSLQQISGDNASLPGNSILTLYKDNDGNLWAGSVREGIFIIKESYIRTFQEAPLGIPFGLSEKSVISIYKENEENVWIGTDGGGINLYSPQSNRFTHYPQTQGDKITSVTKFSDDELLVSIYTRGFLRFNKKTGKYRPFTVVNDSINQLECFYGYLPLAHRVSDDKIYITGFHLWAYHVSSNTFHPIHLADSTLSNVALKLAYANDSVALFTRNNYAYIGDLQTDTIRFGFEINKEENISAVAIDHRQRIWVGTNQGLGYYDMIEGKFHHIPTKLFNNISFLTTDSTGRLWICAQNILFTYDTENDKFTIWNQSDGYTPNEILPTFQKQATSSPIYLGGTEGLVEIQPEKLQAHQLVTPKIGLTDVHFNGTSLRKHLNSNTIHIPWDYLSLSISVQVKTNDVFQKNLIRYIIRKGENERYHESYDPTISLTTLSPGEYSVWASCNMKDGNYTEPTHLIDIIITPPWYKSTWFLILVILAFVALSIYTLLYINRKKEAAVKEEIEQYKQQMDEDKINFLLNLSQRDKEFMTKLNNLITDHLSTEDITIEFLTDKLAMSRASLYSKVKDLTGLGVNDYVNRLRIEKAIELLTNTDMSINDISYEVGFTYPRYFSTLFKKVKGMTPTQFKEQIKLKEIK